MFTFSNAPLGEDDKDMEMFYFMTALDAMHCSVKNESYCSTSELGSVHRVKFHNFISSFIKEGCYFGSICG